MIYSQLDEGRTTPKLRSLLIGPRPATTPAQLSPLEIQKESFTGQVNNMTV